MLSLAIVITMAMLRARYAPFLKKGNYLMILRIKLAYSTHSTRWTMPALNYEKYFVLPGNTLLHLIFIDTWGSHYYYIFFTTYFRTDLTSSSKGQGGPPRDEAKAQVTLDFLDRALNTSR